MKVNRCIAKLEHLDCIRPITSSHRWHLSHDGWIWRPVGSQIGPLSGAVINSTNREMIAYPKRKLERFKRLFKKWDAE